jgi:hypothetical protein
VLKGIKIVSVGMLAAGMLALAVPMGANAAARTTVAGAGRPAVSQSFAAQARHAGLTSTQAATLQKRVNGYLAKYRERHIGAWQIAANEIRFKGGDLLLTLPGQKHVRNLISPSKTGAPVRVNSGSPIYNCPYFELCAFHLAGYTGDMITAYRCGVDVFIPWPGPAAGNFPWGSWVNNQTLGTVGLFLYGSGAVQGSTGPATSTHYYQDWTYVAYMDPC